MFGLEVFVAQYLQLVLGYSPLEAGLWSLPRRRRVRRRLAADAAAGGTGAARRVAMLGGIVVAIAGVALLTQAQATDGPGSSWPASSILSLGLAPLFTLAADLAVGSAPPERAGAASGISETSSELGGALGLALLGTVGTAVYRGSRRRHPRRVPRDAAATASDTLGGAFEVADRLPQPLAADLLEPAREAFTHGLQVAATRERRARARGRCDGRAAAARAPRPRRRCLAVEHLTDLARERPVRERLLDERGVRADLPVPVDRLVRVAGHEEDAHRR